MKKEDQKRFEQAANELGQRMSRDGDLAKLRDKVRLSITPEGLRIEILDEADFAMFDIGTNRLSRAAAELLVEVGGAISTLPNPIAMRDRKSKRLNSSH